MALEHQLLDQIRVVYTDAVFPVWVDQRTAIYIKIGLCTESQCERLVKCEYMCTHCMMCLKTPYVLSLSCSLLITKCALWSTGAVH